MISLQTSSLRLWIGRSFEIDTDFFYIGIKLVLIWGGGHDQKNTIPAFLPNVSDPRRISIAPHSLKPLQNETATSQSLIRIDFDSYS